MLIQVGFAAGFPASLDATTAARESFMALRVDHE
jgi:hypothetical protein